MPTLCIRLRGFRLRRSRFPVRAGLPVALGLALLLLAACSRSRSAAPEVPASALQTFRRGVEAYREEDYPRAAHLFELAAAKDERNAIVYYNLGLAYYMLEAYPESIEAYQKCLKLDPKFTDAHMNLALAYDRTYDLDQANAHYNEYLALVRASRPKAEGAPGGGSAKPAAAAGSNADGAPSAKKARPAMGGEPLSSLPGGNLYQPKPDAQAAARARAGQSSPGARVPVNELRRAPVDSGKGQPFRPNDSSSNDAAQWWTQESLPKTR